MEFYGSPDTVPQADDNEDASKEPGVPERTNGEEDAPQEPPSDREETINPRGDERSGIDERISPPTSPCFFDCQDVGCTWPCAHHSHKGHRFTNFSWYPDAENCGYQHPEIPRVQSEMKDCQFCHILFSITQSGCAYSGKKAHDDYFSKKGCCRCEKANCYFRPNGQLEFVHMLWTCHPASYELGLPTARDARVFPYIAPCMGDLNYDPGSDESLALMRGWIDNCQRGHQLCKMMPQQVGGPKRLLQCLSNGSVRLVETGSRTQRCEYIALSYCWGDGKAVMKTTEKTLDRHQRGIPDESLPPLFQEVVALARGLNIAHLWIDSLCIIQDSGKDKVEEIQQMSDIFRGALVVVVAATASSPLDSLLRVKPQDQSHTWRTASRIVYEEMDLDVKFRRRRSNNEHIDSDATFHTPIATRAWCFQEKLLASRCLVFCEDEVVWECRSCCLCECGGEQEHFSDEGFIYRRYQKMLLPLAEHEAFQLDGTLKYFADAEAAYSFWASAVEKYSGRALTKRTDRLPAISAVAWIVAQATGDRYLAGLWRDDLLAGLCWVAGGSTRDKDLRPHQEYIAPTWSWASRKFGGVYFPSYRGRLWHDADRASVVDAWTVVEGPNLCGPVSDGAIVLSGVHCDVEMTIAKSRDMQLDFRHGKVEIDPRVAVMGLDYEYVEPDTKMDRLGEISRYLRRVTDGETDKQPACSGTVHLLRLDQDVSLILTPSRREKGAYERLGIFDQVCYEEYGLPGFALEFPKTMQRSNITLV